jgi:hypothetical protein
MAIPNMFTVRMYAQRVLGDRSGQARDTADGAWKAMIGPSGTELSVAFQLESAPAEVGGADLIVNSGASAGKMLPMQRVQDDMVILGGGLFGGVNAAAGGVKVGDEVQIDNTGRPSLSPPPGSQRRLQGLGSVPIEGLQQYTPDTLTDAVLAKIDADWAKLPPES